MCTWRRKRATDQVRSDAQVFSDGVLVLGGRCGLPRPRPLAVDLLHGIVWNFREHRLGRVIFLQA